MDYTSINMVISTLQGIEKLSIDFQEITGNAVMVYYAHSKDNCQNWFTIEIKDAGGMNIYCVDCSDAEDTYNHLSAMLTGARIAKNIEV